MPYGDTPYSVRGEQVDLKRLFYSEPNIALTKEITIPPGYGNIPQGTVMAKISEAAGQRVGMYVPYTPERPTAGNQLAIGAAYLVVNGAADAYAYVTMEDSYKFAVGDHLAVADNTNYASQGTSAIDLGAITAIDRTTSTWQAKITVTNNVTTNYTVARSGWVWIQTTTAAPFCLAKGILIGAVDTGTGANAKGGIGHIVISNAMLYAGMLNCYDSEVATDIGSITDGQFVILK